VNQIVAAGLGVVLVGATLPAGIDVTSDAARLAVHRCAEAGHKVSVAIVGPEGDLRALLRGDGAPPHSVESARRKAYTAMTFGKSTEELAKLVTSMPDASGLTRLDGTMFVGGGVPIRRAGEVIGGVGVAGANGPGHDEKCAVAAAVLLEGAKP
jgi:uncharacterized protein GlcG (DUF336 family)